MCNRTPSIGVSIVKISQNVHDFFTTQVENKPFRILIESKDLQGKSHVTKTWGQLTWKTLRETMELIVAILTTSADDWELGGGCNRQRFWGELMPKRAQTQCLGGDSFVENYGKVSSFPAHSSGRSRWLKSELLFFGPKKSLCSISRRDARSRTKKNRTARLAHPPKISMSTNLLPKRT